jgi:FixJ family two-component response regulator
MPKKLVVNAMPNAMLPEAMPLIAVVDDDESIRRALWRMLRGCEFEVITFASGEEFLDSLVVRRPDCVILDFQMPGLNGRDVQRRLALPNIRLPIIIVTAHDQPAIREQCLADGASAYLAKPLLHDCLISAINAAIARPIDK